MVLWETGLIGFTLYSQIYISLRHIFPESYNFMLLSQEHEREKPFSLVATGPHLQINVEASWLIDSTVCFPTLTVSVKNFRFTYFFRTPTHSYSRRSTNGILHTNWHGISAVHSLLWDTTVFEIHSNWSVKGQYVTVGCVSPMVRETWVQSQVASYQRL